MKALIQSHLTMLDQAQKIMPNPMLDPRLEIRETAASASAGE